MLVLYVETPNKVEGKFYRMVVRPTMLCTIWIIEIWILRWICGYTRLGKIELITSHPQRVQIAYLDNEIRKVRVRWYGYVLHRSLDSSIYKGESVTMRRLKVIEADGVSSVSHVHSCLR